MKMRVTYLELRYLFSHPGDVLIGHDDVQFMYDPERAAILRHNPVNTKQTGWYIARGLMIYASQYRLAVVDTIHWTLSPYSEEDMDRFAYEQDMSW